MPFTLLVALVVAAILGAFLVEAVAEGDRFCDSFYRNETAGAGLCSDIYTCAEYITNGVSFVCNNAHEECGSVQNASVQWVLKLSFSLVPCFCVCMGIIALCFYPRCARTEAFHEKLLEAITKLRRGETVEDPWRPGSWVMPALPPTENQGALSYFTPNELKMCLTGTTTDNEPVSVLPLLRWSLFPAVGFATLIPVGGIIMTSGWEDLFDDLGASVSPLGLMILGVGVVGTWFHSTRALAAWHLHNKAVACEEVKQKYNSLCPFTGAQRYTINKKTPDNRDAPPPEKVGNGDTI